MKIQSFKELNDGQKFIYANSQGDAVMYVKTHLSDRDSSEKCATNLSVGLTLKIDDDTQVISIVT